MATIRAGEKQLADDEFTTVRLVVSVEHKTAQDDLRASPSLDQDMVNSNQTKIILAAGNCC
ncbi:MAG: hypothetical protein AB1453_08720 [Chloroflexota bacterium]